jgi:hypothetical protein
MLLTLNNVVMHIWPIIRDMNSEMYKRVIDFKHAMKSSPLGVAFYLRKAAAEQKFKYHLRNSKQETEYFYTIKMLAINSKNYVLLAETCIFSFLRFHPRSFFELHVDPELEIYAKQKFRSLIRSNNIEIKVLRERREFWQTTKLEIILGMNGTSSIFMDADLRWNGILPKISGITAYVEEYEISSSMLHSKVKELMPDSNFIRMANCSFFGFDTVNVDGDLLNQIRELELQINSLQKMFPESQQLLAQSRLSEQLSLSYILRKNDKTISYLKIKGERNDGDFVESCYFGVSGLTF